MATLGEKLKRERELRNITIEEISEATKIQIRFLKALEKDNFENLPAEAFVKGFIEAYCKFIGINERDMVNKYLLQTQEEEEENENRSEEKEENIGYVLPVFVISLLILLVGLSAGFYYSAKKSEKKKGVSLKEYKARESMEDPAASSETSGEAKSDKSSQPAGVEKQITSEDDSALSSEQNEAVLELTIKSGSKSWIKISKENEVLLDRILKAGEKKRLKITKEGFRLSVGNAGGVSLAINGNDVPPLGSSGEVVRNILISKDTMDELSQKMENNNKKEEKQISTQ